MSQNPLERVGYKRLIRGRASADRYRDWLHRNDSGQARRWSAGHQTQEQAARAGRRGLDKTVHVTRDADVSCRRCGRRWPRVQARVTGEGFWSCPAGVRCVPQPDWRDQLALYAAELEAPYAADLEAPAETAPPVAATPPRPRWQDRLRGWLERHRRDL